MHTHLSGKPLRSKSHDSNHSLSVAYLYPRASERAWFGPVKGRVAAQLREAVAQMSLHRAHCMRLLREKRVVSAFSLSASLIICANLRGWGQKGGGEEGCTWAPWAAQTRPLGRVSGPLYLRYRSTSKRAIERAPCCLKVHVVLAHPWRVCALLCAVYALA